ncbi:MAG: hypothetical protein EAZ53_09265 [Bacteroidetes bacterium]|nr:MAG: hypothetical protein EAZ53_09265 [Bacteroidota bacterium]
MKLLKKRKKEKINLKTQKTSLQFWRDVWGFLKHKDLIISNLYYFTSTASIYSIDSFPFWSKTIISQ